MESFIRTVCTYSDFFLVIKLYKFGLQIMLFISDYLRFMGSVDFGLKYLSEALFETCCVRRFFLRWSRPLVLEIFAESMDGDSLLDLSKDLLSLEAIGEF